MSSWSRGAGSNTDIEWGGSSNGSYQGGGSFGSAGDEYQQEALAFASNFKQIVFHFNQITDQHKFLTTDRDTQEFRDKLNQKIDAAQGLAKTIQQNLKRLNSAATNTGSAAERKERKRVVDKLQKDFTSFTDRFNSELQKLDEKLESYPPKPAPKGFGLPSREEYGSTAGYQDDYDPEAERVSLIQAQRQADFLQVENQSDFQRTQIVEREEAIKKLQGEMVEVHEVFRDLAVLVGEQGEFINNIESNIESTVHSTKQAKAEIDKAATYQSKARSKLCCIVLLIAILAAAGVIAIVVWQVVKNKTS